MGMYTGLRVKGYIKQEYKQMIKEINEGAEWEDFVNKFPFLKEFASMYRSSFIPHGSLAYMPDEWEEGEFPNQRDTDGFEKNIDMETGYWTFQCSLKNYDDEIEIFMDKVTPFIFESIEHFEVYYEEWEVSKLYKFKDGKLIDTSDGIRYIEADTWSVW